MVDCKTSLWRQIQKENFTSFSELFDYLELSGENREKVFTNPRFVLNLPKRLAAKFQKNSTTDPLFRQFVPLNEEQIITPGFSIDPVQDTSFCKSGKILQKYKGRALLLCTSACAMHCRFCFRQNYPYETKKSGFDQELASIGKDLSIEEVIFSGGDPLSLSDSSLETLFSALENMPHIQRIRFHTRFPIGIPERIDDSFLNILKKSTKQIFFVIHCNHEKELDRDVLYHLRKILMLGIPVLCQTVLLKGVNDNPETMIKLCQKLINQGMIPYYFHLLDLVQGASHFLVEQQKAIELMRQMQKSLSGFALPRLVREEPGKFSKTIVF